jgi:hypothetical protein
MNEIVGERTDPGNQSWATLHEGVSLVRRALN